MVDLRIKDTMAFSGRELVVEARHDNQEVYIYFEQHPQPSTGQVLYSAGIMALKTEELLAVMQFCYELLKKDG